MSAAAIEYLLDGVAGGTALALVAALVCALPAVRARASLVFAIWAVVLARFIAGGLVPIDMPLAAVAPETHAAAPGAAPAAGSAAIVEASGWQSWLALAWLAGVIAVAGVSAIGWLRLRRRIAALPAAPAEVRSRAQRLAAGLGLRRRVAVLIEDGSGPWAAGVIAAVVVIPGSLAGDVLDDVLAHELAHHRRLDPLWALIARAATVLFFFWPAVWFAGRRLAAARERATDQLAVERCGRDRRRYARTLVRMTLVARGQAALAMASAGSLRSRIDTLLAGAPSGVGRRGVALLIALVALGLPAAEIAAERPDAGPLECTIGPGVGARILASHPDADRDGDGVLSRDEICEHQRRMQQRLVEAAVAADVWGDGDALPSSPAAVTALAGVTELDIELADAGGAVCAPPDDTANRCVEEMVLIDVSAD